MTGILTGSESESRLIQISGHRCTRVLHDRVLHDGDAAHVDMATRGRGLGMPPCDDTTRRLMIYEELEDGPPF